MKKILYPSVLVVVLGIGVLLMYSIWGAVAPRTAAQFLESGKQYFEQKKFPEATVEFQNALQKEERNRDARLFLARSYLAQGDVNSAVMQLRSLLEYYPDDQEASLQLGNVYLQGGSRDPQFFREAKSIADKVLAKDPKNVVALLLLGNALAGLRDYTASIEQLERALTLDPQNTATLVSLGATQAVQKIPEAEQTFLKAREVDPKNIGALISLAGYYQATGKLDEAEKMYKEALAVSVGDRRVYLPAVMFYAGTNRPEEAEKVLKDAQAATPTDPNASLVLAALYRAKNREADARNLLRDLKSKFPKNNDVVLGYAELLYASDPAAGLAELEAILKTDPHNVPAQVLFGEMQFLSGKYDQAAATLNAPSIVGGRYPQAHLLLGKIDVSKGLADKAQEHYQKALEMDPRYMAARLALAELLLQRGRIPDAGVEVQKVLDVDRNSVPARLLKASVDTLQGKFADAEKELIALQKEQPDSAAIHLRTGMYYQVRGNKPNAEKSLLRALELQPGSDDILRSVAQYFVTERATDRALQVINTTVPDAKKRAFHYDLMGLVYSRGGRPQEAEAALRKAIQMEPDRVDSKANLATEYINMRRFDDALKQIDDVLKLVPTNASAYMTKGLIYQAQENIPAAKENYERSLQIEPNTFVSANNLAYLLGEEGRDLEVALNYAQTARRLAPDQPASADTLGWIQYKLGRHVSARDQLQFAVSKQPNNPTFQYHLGLIYKETKQIPEAQAALQKAVSSKEEFKEKSLAEAALKEVTQKK